MSKRQSKKPLIYALEPRLLFDGDLGADIASAIVYRDGNASDTAPTVAPENQRENQRENISFASPSSRSAIVFIDDSLEDPQTLADAAADDAQIHILDGDSDGFAQINDILQNQDRVNEIHIFGHGTAGEARLGTASLSLETLTTHSDTLAALKDTLTEDGDILLYGCNIAAGDNGQTFIEELAELTAADIAASDDITGAGGDWELEASTGPIEANAIEAWDYQYSLTPDGVASMNANVVERTHSNLNVKARPDISNSDKNNNRGFYDYDNSERFVIALEKSNISATETLYFDFGVSVGQGGSYNVSSGQRVASYLVALNNDVGRRDSGNAQIVFENEILGYYVDKYNTLGSGTMRGFDASEEGSFQGQGDGDTDVTEISNSYFANSSWAYPTTSQINKRDSEGYFQRAFGTGSSSGADYIWTSNNTTLNFAAKNGNTSGTGDFIRVITKWQSPPTVTSATDVSGSATELTDGHANENTATLSDTGSFTIADSNGDTVSVSRAFSSTTHSSNAAFGDLTADIANNTTTDGTGQINWTYSVDDSDLEALDAGESYVETWTITVSDGSANVTQNVTVTINGAADSTNDAPTVSTAAVDPSINEAADASAQALNESGTITFADAEDTNLTITGAASATVTAGSGVSVPSDLQTALEGAFSVTDNNDNTAGWTLNATDLDLDFLAAGQTITLAYVVTATDDNGASVTDTITATITGTNDAPTVSTPAVDPSINEAADASAQALNESGTITFADAEDTNLTITGAASATVTAGSGVSVPSDLQTALEGAFSVTDNNDNTAGWTLNATDLDLDFLAAGQTITLAYVVTATDDNGASVTDTITATITGTNDAPTVSTPAVDPSINEAADASAQALNESGTITFADAEDTNLTITGAASATVTAGSGVSVPSDLQTALEGAFSVTDNNDNTAGWTLNATDLDLDFLAAGQTITLAYVVTATDDNGASVTDTITATITGTNDAPTVSTPAVDPSINEAADASAQALNESGTITFADAEDTNLTITGAASATVTAGSGVSVPSDLQTALEGAFSVTDNNDNTAGWTLNATDLDLDFLAAGQTITLAYVVTATDDNGASVTDTITATITGTNDAPTVSTPAVDPSINEAADASAQALNESGTITFADAEDTNLTITGAASATVTAGSGVSVPSDLQTALEGAFSVTDNNDNTAGWTLNATDLDLDFLTAGQTITLAYVVTATDDNGASVTDTITATITGTNDAPVAADIIASVLEGSTIQSGASRADLIGPTGHVYDSGGYQIGYETVGPMDLAFSPDGNKLYVLAQTNMQGNIDKRVLTYDLQSPWGLSPRTFNGANDYDLPADPPSISNNAAPNDRLMTAGMAFGEAGTKMFVSQYNQLDGTLYSFDLSTAYDVSTATPSGTPSITIPDTSGENRFLEPFDGRFDLGFSEDGLSMFTLEQHKGQQGSGAGMLRQLAKYNLSTAWDISTADMNNRTTHVFSTTDGTEVEAGFVFGGSGTKLFVIDVGNLDTNTGSAIREYNLATPYDISNMTEVRVTSLDGEWFAKHLYSIELSADETKIYLTGHGGGNTGAYIYEFDIFEDPALSNDTDAEGDALTLTFVASDAVASGTTYANGTDIDGQYGTLTIGANGSYRYVSNESAQDALDAGDKVTDSFAYTVSDGSATSTANLVVTVIGVNDTPTAANNTVTINEDFTKTFAASDFNFADVDASSSLSSIKITSLPATGALTLNGTAVSQNQTIAASQIANLVFTPVANGNGDPYTTFQFKVNDGTVDSASAYTMTVDVTPNNDAPTVSTAAVDPSINEAADASAQALNESGTITFADAEDTNLTITGAASATVTAGSGVSVPSDLQTALEGAFSVTDNDDNTAGWTLNATDLDLDFLAAGQTITLAYVVTATDDNGASVTDTITATITGTNDAPTVSTPAVDPSINEAADASAQALNESGTITFADAEDTNLTITGAASATVTAGSGVSVPSDLQTALEGAFSVTDNNDNTAGWTLNATDLDLDFLAAGQTITLAYVVTATDDNGASVTDTITATITGTNDAPTVSTPAVDPSINEAADASAQALNESGTITFADAEDTNLTITGAASATVTAGSGVSVPSDLQTALEGAFSVTDNNDNTAGWTLNATDLDLDFLAAGQTITLAYVVTATDDNGASVTDTITATITGTNDAPTVSTPAVDPSINEAADASAQALNESGTITFADAEDTNLTITGAASATVTAGSGVSVPSDLQTALEGAFSVTDNDDNTAGWTLNATDLDLDFLAAGQTITLAYVVTATDDNGASVTDTITATITGTNDAPTVSTPAVDPSINEAADASAQALNESGTITFADAEDTNLTITGAASATVTAGSGVSVPSDLQTALEGAFSVTDNNDNTAGWTLNATDLDLDFLAAGQTITLAYVVTATDDNGASVTDTITATITGTNDAPTVSTPAVDPSINEAADASAQALNESGTITFADAEDTNLTITGAASATVTAGSGVSVPSDLQTALEGAFSVTDNNDNTAGWTLNATDLDLDFLAAGQTITLAYVVTATDDNGASVTDTITATITGTNDAPTVSTPAVDPSINEAADASAQALNESGTITFADAEDTNLTITGAASATVTAGSGVSVPSDLQTALEGAFSVTDNNDNTAGWTLNATDLDLDFLAAGQTITLAYVVTATDDNGASVTDTITATITGTNDAPTVSTPAVDPSINEAADASAQALNESGTITFADAEDTNLTITGAASATVTAGSGVSVPSDLQTALEGAFSVTDNNDNTAGWTLNATDLDLDFLAAGQTITLAYVVTATDDNGASETDTITATITGTNDAPTSADVTFTINEGATKIFNDGNFPYDDVDGDAFRRIKITALPDAGSLVFGNADAFVGQEFNHGYQHNLNFTPDANGNGDSYAAFQIQVADYNLAWSESAYTITIDVTPVNNAPTAADDTIAATSGIDATGTVLTNDSDPDGTIPTISAFATSGGAAGTVGSALTGNYGSLTFNSNGTYTYVVDADNANVLALGADDDPLTETFNYTITDGSLTDTATITVNVAGVNDAPIVSAITDSTTEDAASFDTDLLSAQTDPDGDTLSVSGSSITAVDGNNESYNLPDGTASVTNGTLSVDPTKLNGLGAGESVDITVTYDVSDGTTTTQNTATITVTGVNDAPVVSAITDSTTEDAASFDTDLLSAQTDPDGDTLSVSGSSITAVDGNNESYNLPDGTASVTNGTLSVDPTKLNGLGAGESVDITVTYDVSDGTTTTQNTATITVTGVNDAPVVSAITDSTTEDAASFDTDLLSAQTDPDGDTLSVSGSSITAVDGNNESYNLPDGTASVTNGTLSVDPTKLNGLGAGESVDITVTYDVSDGTTTTQNTATITVTGVNDAPVVSAITDSTTEDAASFDTDLLSAQTDPDGDTLSVSGSSITAVDGNNESYNLPDGTASVTNGTLSVDPTKLNGLGAGESVDITVTYDVSDGTTTTQNTATITVTGVNDAPVVSAITDSTTEDAASFDTDLLSAQTDPDGDTLSVSGSSITAVDGNNESYNLPDGTASVTNGTLSVDPTKLNGLGAGESVDITVTYDVSDGTTTTQNTATITVTGVNDAPVVSAITDSTTEDAASFDTDLLSAQTDPDGDTLSVSGSSITAVDGNNESYNLPDGTASVTNGTLSVDPTKLNGLGAGESVDITVTYDVSDGTTTTQNTATITVTGVNDAPVVSAITDSTTEDAASFDTDLLSAQTDPDGDTLSVSGSSITAVDGNNESYNLPDGTASVTNGTLSVDPTKLNGLGAGESVDITVTYDVSDGTTTTQNTATITVTGVNDAPVVSAITDSTTEDAASFDTDLLSAQTDPDGDTLSVSGSSITAVDGNNESYNLPDGTASVTNGTLSVDPTKLNGLGAGESVDITVTYDVSDGTTTTQNTATITVTGVNDAPVVSAITDSTTEDAASFDTDLLSAQTDPDGDTLSVSGSSITAVDGNNESYNLPDGTASVTNGTLSVDPTKLNGLGAGESVDITVTYDVSDGTTTTQNTATITVTGVNDAPVVSAITDSTTEDAASFDTDLLSAQTDPDGDTLSVSGSSITAVDGNNESYNLPDGTASVTNGTLSVDPTKLNGLGAGESVDITVTYDVSDGTTTTQNTATITVTGVNDAPVVSAITDSTTEDAASFDTDLLSAQTDPDGDTLSVSGSSITAVDGNNESYNLPDGTASVTNGTLSVDPTKLNGLGAGESVDITVTYDVSDGTTTTQNTATITVTGVNDAPVVSAITDSTTEDAASFDTDLLSAQTDPDGDTLSVSGSSITAVDGNNESYNLPDGTASVTNGTLSVDPTKLNGLGAGESVDITVTYDVSDGTTTTQNTATITVTGVNDAPVVSAITDSTTEDAASFDTDLLSAQTDPDGDTLSVSGSSITAVDGNNESYNLPDGTASVTNGTLSVDPTKLNGLGAGESVDITVTYDVSDGTTTTQNTATITVTGVNDAPVVSAITDSTTEDAASFDTDLLSAQTDPDGDTLSVSGSSITAVDGNNESYNLPDGTASVTNGTLSVDPTKLNGLGAGESVDITVTYDVSDGTTTTQNTATITVTGANDAPVAADDAANVFVGTEFTGNAISGSMTGADFDLDANTMLTVSALGDSPIADTDGASATAISDYGTLVVGRDGSVNYNADQSGASQLSYGDAAITDNFTYTLSDGNEGSDTATISFSVTAPNPTNTLPTAADNTLFISEDASVTFVPEHFNFNDADDDRLRQITIVSVPQAGTLMNGRNPINAGDTLSVGEIENLSYSPASNANGTDYASLTFRVNDGTADSAAIYNMTFDITARNDLPTAAHNRVTIDEDTSKSFSVAEFGFADVDADNSLSSIKITSLPAVGTLTLGNTALEDGDVIAEPDIDNVKFTPVTNASGDAYASFTFTVNDGTVDSASSYKMTVDVAPKNDLSTAADNTITIAEDGTHRFASSEFNFADIDSDSLDHITIVTVPAAGTLALNGVAVGADDDIAAADITNLVFIPIANASGDEYASFTFTVNDGTADSALSYTMTVDVTPTNDLPTAADKMVTVAEDSSHTFASNEFNFADTDEDSLDHITIATLPAAGTLTLNGVAVDAEDSIAAADITNLVFTPVTNASGDPYASFTFTVNDGTDDSQTVNTMTVNVTQINDAPTATPLSIAFSKTDADDTFDLLQGVTDLEGNELSLTSAPGVTFIDKTGNQVALPAGAAIINGNIVEISPATFSSLGIGEDVSIVIDYVISDGDETVNNSATITISGGNTQPQIIDETDDNREGTASVRTNEDTTLTFAAQQFNFSDTDANDTLSHVAILTLPENGDLRLDGDLVETGDVIPEDQIRTLTFTPEENGNGENYANFRYLVSDGKENSAAGTMSLHVDAVNDLPTTENGRLQLNGDDEIALSGRNFAFADIEGDSLNHVTIVSAPTEGTLYLNNQPVQDGDTIAESQLNLLTYKPGDNASGVNYDAFTFSVNDGEEDSASASTIAIGVNAAPAASDSLLETNEGELTRADLLATDQDDAILQYEITKQPDHGTLRLINGGPDYIYTPDAFYYGSDSFKFVATDTVLTSEEAVVSLTVRPVNNAPIERRSLPAQAIMLEGKIKPIKLADFFGDVDAFDPSKKGFETNVKNLLEIGKFPKRAKLDPIPLDGMLTFTVESSLPLGLTFNGQSISGRPTEAGVYDIIMQATDGLGLKVQSSFQLFVGMPVGISPIEAPQQEAKREDTKTEETISNLNEHDLPGVLKVNPKSDGIVPMRDAIAKDYPAAALGNSASLAEDAWTRTTFSSEQDISGNLRVADLEINGQEIAVRLADGAVDQAETFKGKMADGSKLPDWIQVDLSTGQTKAVPPQGAMPVEMVVIANDGAGNERAINLILNPEALFEEAKDAPLPARETDQERRESRQSERQERRETRQSERLERRETRQAERQERREARQAERKVPLEAREENTLERKETRAVRDASRNNPEFSVLTDGSVRFVEGLTAVGEGSMELMRIVSASESMTIEITDTSRIQTTRYEVRQQDGAPAPDWVQIDAATGALIIEAPKNTSTIKLTLVAFDDTQQRSVDLDINLDKMREDFLVDEVTTESEDTQTDEPAAASETTVGQFLPLDKQIDAALTDTDYGQDLQATIQERS